MTKDDYLRRLNQIDMAITNALAGTKAGYEFATLQECQSNLEKIYIRVSSYTDLQLEHTIVNYGKS